MTGDDNEAQRMVEGVGGWSVSVAAGSMAASVQG